MAAVSVPAFRGVLVPASLATWSNLAANDPTATDAAKSFWTAAEPRPGGCTPDDAWSDFRAEISGSQDRSLDLVVREGGFPPGPSSWGTGARVAYAYPEDTDVDGGSWPGPAGDGALRGWDPPTIATRHKTVDTYGSGTSYALSACVIPSSQQVVVAGTYVTSHRTRTNTWDPYTDTAGSSVVVSAASTSAIGDFPPAILCVPGSERLVVYASDDFGESSYFSDDQGATWDPYAFNVTAGAAVMGSMTRRSAFVCPNGDWSLWHAKNGQVDQWVSTNGGASFALVASESRATPLWPSVAIATRSGSILVLQSNTTTGAPQVLRLASASDDHSSATAVTVSTTAATYAWISEDADGVVWVLFSYSGGGATVVAVKSDDDGATWEMCTHGPIETINVFLGAGHAVHAAGAMHIAHSYAITDYVRAITTCGGWSSVTTGVDYRATDKTIPDPDTKRIGYSWHYDGAGAAADGLVWFPAALPSAMGWTGAGAGAVVLTGATNGGDLLLTTTGANARTYTRTLTTFGGARAHVVLTPSTGGSLAALTMGCKLRISKSGGAAHHAIGVRCTNGQVQVFDEIANTAIGSAWSYVPTGSTIEVLVLFRRFTSTADTWLEVYARIYGTTRWVLVTSQRGGLTDGGALVASDFMWGQPTGTAVATWRMAGIYAQDAGGGQAVWPIWNGSASPDPSGGSDNGHWPVTGRPASPVPYPLGDARTLNVAETVSGAPFVRGVGGPARFNERFSCAVAYGYGPERLFNEVAPSPSDGWESAIGVSAEVNDHWFTFVEDYARTLGSWSAGLFLDKINFRYAKLQEWTGAAWSTLGTFDAAVDGVSTLKWTRTGSTVTVTATSPTLSRYFRDGELAGGTFMLDGYARVIADNTAGVWNPADTHQITITLEGVDGTEPASGTAGELWVPQGCLIVHKVETPRTRFRVLLEAQATASNTFKAGKMVVGGFVPFGRQWSDGYAMDADPNVDMNQDPRGTSYVDVKGDVIRAWTVAWTDGALTRGLRGTTPAPDFLAATGAAAGKSLAAKNDVALLALGVLSRLRGKACVLLRSVPATTPVMVTDPDLLLYSRMESPLRVEQITGPEERGGWVAGSPAARPVGELLRVSPITFRAIV